jgi:hypothetical protein
VTVLLAGIAVALAAASGLPGVLLRRRPDLAQRLCCALLCGGAALGTWAALATHAGAPPGFVEQPGSEPRAAI